jgi:hypothetical protein
MKNLFMFIERFFWSMVWVFLALIVGFWLLGWIQNQDGLVGSWAGWVTSHAEPH